jgi:hypothetical protein
MKTTRTTNPNIDPNNEKIKSLQEMIATAERTIMSAKQMLLQLQRESGQTMHIGAPEFSSSSEGQIIHGTFDGQIMVGEDGKQYPVPANYASKSKLVEGDMLKLTITTDGNFVYKQIGPVDRKYLIGIVEQDERGNYAIIADGKKYKVLLAAATYFKIELGDEVTLVVPRNHESVWGAIENVLRKASEIAMARTWMPTATEVPASIPNENAAEPDFSVSDKPAAIAKLEKEIEEERKMKLQNDMFDDLEEEWTPDLEALKKEASHPVGADTDEEPFHV